MHDLRGSSFWFRALVVGALALLAMAASLATPALAAASPTVESITPNQGPAGGGTVVTIKGTGFVTGATVTIGAEATESFVVSGNEITAKTGSGSGSPEVVVSQEGASSTGGPKFTYVPQVEHITPGVGPITGGTAVVIKGAGFVTGATVTIGAAATEVVVVSGTEITAKTGSDSGSPDVVVSQEGVSSTGGPKFTYDGTTPTVDSITPNVGPAKGDTVVKIVGTGFVEGATVAIGAPASNVLVVSETEITATTGATTAGMNEVTVSDAGGMSIMSPAFFTYFNAPTVETTPASSITQTTATLSAKVNPEGGEVTECKLEYGTNEAYGAHVPCSSSPGSGTSAVPVSAAAAGLSPNTIYHFRISATNAEGTTPGTDATFKTLPNPPTVEAKPASSITQTTATLNATVNPNGGEVGTCEFEYGETPSYGKKVTACSAPGSGPSPVEVSASLTGLAANTTYYFRISRDQLGRRWQGPDSKGHEATFATPRTESCLPGTPTYNSGTINATTTTKPGLPRPVVGHTANIAPFTGQVLVRTPGSSGFVALKGARQIPFGTIIEATKGEVSVTAATSTGGLWAGRFFDGKFVLTQSANGNVLATLVGGNFSPCKPRAHAGRATSTASPGHLVRRLWAETGGDFTTKGKYAQGAVQGAQWLTEDLCEGTLILATRDRVQVTDFVHRLRTQLVAGHIDLVKSH